MFQIEKNVPLPANAGHAGRNAKYPLRDMEVGDSFFVPAVDRPNSISRAAGHMAKRMGNGVRFCTRTENGGVRVWRLS